MQLIPNVGDRFIQRKPFNFKKKKKKANRSSFAELSCIKVLLITISIEPNFEDSCEKFFN